MAIATKTYVTRTVEEVSYTLVLDEDEAEFLKEVIGMITFPFLGPNHQIYEALKKAGVKTSEKYHAPVGTVELR